MAEWKKGGLVKSKAGHDKDCFYIIMKIEGPYLYLADGTIRTLDKLKKKNEKHVQHIVYTDDVLQTKILHNAVLRNEDIKKAIKGYRLLAQADNQSDLMND
ncbi:MAG: hypothetical protein ACI4C1_10470 [Lachnospiraceae bacterium]